MRKSVIVWLVLGTLVCSGCSGQVKDDAVSSALESGVKVEAVQNDFREAFSLNQQ